MQINSKLVSALISWDTWIVLLIVIMFGIVGSMAHKLMPSNDPSNDNKMSFLGYIVVGAVASLAVLFIFPPNDDALRLVALAVVSGYGGKAILDALEARMKVAIAQAEVKAAKEEANKNKTEAKEAKTNGKKAYDSFKKSFDLASNYVSLKKNINDTVKQDLISATIHSNFNLYDKGHLERQDNELKELSDTMEKLKEYFENE